jgi:hypothetical protein
MLRHHEPPDIGAAAAGAWTPGTAEVPPDAGSPCGELAAGAAFCVPRRGIPPSLYSQVAKQVEALAANKAAVAATLATLRQGIPFAGVMIVAANVASQPES